MTGIEAVTPRATEWTTGTIITKEQPTPDQVRLRLHVEDRQRHDPGQHYVVRLRAPDDYTAQRSYSVASDGEDPLLELLVERLPDGEVSGHLADVAEVGDVLEVRGPIGRWFRWDARTPAVCLVGGTGVVPAVAMLRTARRLGRTDLLRVAAVGRSPEHLPYAAELARAGALVAYTRHDAGDRPAGPPRPDELAPLAEGAEVAFICGSPRFVALATPLLIGAGVDPTTIRVEQFGATG
ncbi:MULTISPECIES: FAD-binding oxidoreductase [unclassified Nocardioides]|uniref:FAD-binding oxidoreductase n=1 Tax=unclassified Nocardioides TaxID=2615069 RepID=UPI002665094C|nr:FAD-binding oxidoreductase [Nocardioides sp. Arc9.136]WKN50565.1 FAD-binding oxidoreductase [Nocardioides sp. Arc9.136]